MGQQWPQSSTTRLLCILETGLTKPEMSKGISMEGCHDGENRVWKILSDKSLKLPLTFQFQKVFNARVYPCQVHCLGRGEHPRKVPVPKAAEHVLQTDWDAVHAPSDGQENLRGHPHHYLHNQEQGPPDKNRTAEGSWPISPPVQDGNEKFLNSSFLIAEWLIIQFRKKLTAHVSLANCIACHAWF